MFFTFDQNSSFGAFVVDAKKGISHFVVIEARNKEEAAVRAENIGLYFNGVEAGIDCECCGDRWDRTEDGFKVPTVCGETRLTQLMKSGIKWIDGPEGFIHYKNKKKPAPFWSKKAKAKR